MDIAPLKKNKLLTSSLYCIHMPCQISGVYRASCTLSCHLLGYGQAHTQLYQQNPVSVHKERCLFLYISAVITELYGMSFAFLSIWLLLIDHYYCKCMLLSLPLPDTVVQIQPKSLLLFLRFEILVDFQCFIQ